MENLRGRLDPQSAALLGRLDDIRSDWAERIEAGGMAGSRAYAEEVFATFRGAERDLAPHAVEEITVPTRHGECAARYYRAAAPDRSPAAGCTLFLHGGGWSLGSLDAYDGLVGSLAAMSGIDFLSLDYRLAPEAPFPIAIEQAEDALSWLAEHAKELRFAPGKLAVMGDSAGGNLAAVLARRSALSGRCDLACQVLLYPMTDVVSPAERFASRANYGGGELFLEEAAIQGAAMAYTGGDAALRSDHDISPLAAPVPDGIAQALVLTAEFDPLRDEAVEYHRTLRQAGVQSTHLEGEKTVHAFLSFGELDVAQKNREEISAYLRKIFATGSPA